MPNCAATIEVCITLLVNLTKSDGSSFSGTILSNTFGGTVQTTTGDFISTVLPSISATTPIAFPLFMITSLTLAFVTTSLSASLTAAAQPSVIKRRPGPPAKPQE